MTRQTTEPIDHISLNPTHFTLVELARRINEGMLTLDPPYQRGSVWTEDQRVALVQSWLRGLPAGVVILSDRGNGLWAGPDPYKTGDPVWACIDGKQRLTTALMWRNGDFAVPASWLPADHIATTEDTADGPYFRYTGLSNKGKLFMDRYCSFLVAESKDCATEADEAAFYVLVNGGGTPQSSADMANAARIAGGN